MRPFYILSLFILSMLHSINVSAQINRRESKKSVAYRGQYQRFSTGAHHTLEIRGGTLWAWGSNNSGQLGDGSNTDRLNAVPIGIENNWVRVSAGGHHSLGIKANGTLWAWGVNQYGSLGDGNTTDKSTPVQIGTDSTWICIVAGIGDCSFGIKADGTLWGWGQNMYGELGDGTTVTKLSPVQIGSDRNWITIADGGEHTLGLKTDGTLWAWGHNTYGQLGIGSTTSQTSPVKIATDSNWVQIAAGTFHSLGIKSDGTLWCWGRNDSGQLGDGTTNQSISPIKIGTDQKWVSVQAGYLFSMGLKSDGTLWTWGSNINGQLGDGSTTQRNSPVLIDSNYVVIDAGFFHGTGLKANGSITAWGLNSLGQLGNGALIQQNKPVSHSGLKEWLNITAGYLNTHALMTDGTLWGWGLSFNGQIGDGTGTDKHYPVRVGTDSNWISVVSGNNHSLGLKSDGTLWSWGQNMFGTLGNGTSGSFSKIPVQVGTDNKWVSIASTAESSFGLKSDGTLWSWGRNDFGQLGDGTITQRNAPIQIGSDNHWTSIIAEFWNCVALKSDGTLWTWGYNFDGELGNGNTTDQHTPVQISTERSWMSVSGSGGHSLCLKADGSLWIWGRNANGELGDGTTINRKTPVQLGTDNRWLYLHGGPDHNIAVKCDGTLWTWGNNPNGALGDGTTVSKLTPTRIGSNNNNVTVAGGGAGFAFVIKSERNAFCGTGLNTKGNLGDSTIIDKNAFNCIAFKCTVPSLPVNITPAANLSICEGNSTVLKVTGVGDVRWFTAAVGGIYLGSGTTYITPVLSSDFTFYVQDSTCSLSAGRTVITVTVKPLPVRTTSLNGTIISANQNGATYQWVQCPLFTSIAGATNKSFTPLTTGNYAVIVTMNGCSDTSDCVFVNKSGMVINNERIAAIHIYPNPNDGSFTIEGNSYGTYLLTDAMGRMIRTFTLNASDKYLWKMDDLDAGIYFIVSTTEGISAGKKIIVMK